MSNVSKSLEMRQKRAEIWDRAKNFLNEHTDENGMMSAEDTEQYERMEKEVVDMAAVINRLERAEQMDREMENLAVPPLASRPQQHVSDDKKGIRSENYKKQFWNHMRGRSSYDIRNALQVGELRKNMCCSMVFSNFVRNKSMLTLFRHPWRSNAAILFKKFEAEVMNEQKALIKNGILCSNNYERILMICEVIRA